MFCCIQLYHVQKRIDLNPVYKHITVSFCTTQHCYQFFVYMYVCITWGYCDLWRQEGQRTSVHQSGCQPVCPHSHLSYDNGKQSREKVYFTRSREYRCVCTQNKDTVTKNVEYPFNFLEQLKCQRSEWYSCAILCL